MNFNHKSTLLLGACALTPLAHVARAEVYLSPEQAVTQIFPQAGPAAAAFKKREITLTDEQAKAVEGAAHEDVRNKTLTVYVGPGKEAVFIDQVLGKHELITIAVGVTPEGKVSGIEILEYRETYGYQVRNADWRKQFTGKDKSAPVKVGSDIKNISGATLSSVHVTNGVRRLLQTYDVVYAAL